MLSEILVCANHRGYREKIKDFLGEVLQHLQESAPLRRPELQKTGDEPLFQVVEEITEEKTLPLALAGDPAAVLSWLEDHQEELPRNAWLPLLLVLPKGGEWGEEMENVLGHPQVLLEGIFRSSHLLDHKDWDERARFETSILRVLRRSLKKGEGERGVTKPITWKARIASKGSGDAAFLSLFTDPATQNLLGDMKFAVRDIRARLRRGVDENLPDTEVPFFRLRNLQKQGIKEFEALHKNENRWQKGSFRIPSVLLLGESGTGKTLVARWIAKALYEGILKNSSDDPLPFYRVNIGAISKDLVDSELFGHTQGAFTGADKERLGIFLSHQGSVVFLDEIGDMLPEHQTRLLAYMDNAEVRPTGYDGSLLMAPTIIVGATNRPVDRLAQEESGSFRYDLFCRFDHILRLPPLRERKEDMRLLISLVLQDTEVNPPGENEEPFWIEKISLKAIGYLEKQSYPGNFRELRTLLARGVRKARQEGDRVLYLHHLLKG